MKRSRDLERINKVKDFFTVVGHGKTVKMDQGLIVVLSIRYEHLIRVRRSAFEKSTHHRDFNKVHEKESTCSPLRNGVLVTI